MKVGDKVFVIERTSEGTFEWEGEVTKITNAYIETGHRRNAVTHPQWLNYLRAYEMTWTKHYGHDNDNIKKMVR